jgi:hypothetical protein
VAPASEGGGVEVVFPSLGGVEVEFPPLGGVEVAFPPLGGVEVALSPAGGALVELLGDPPLSVESAHSQTDTMSAVKKPH